jgi:hypothetical protein
MFISSNGKEEQWYKVSLYMTIPFLLSCIALVLGCISITVFRIVWTSYVLVTLGITYIKDTLITYFTE